MLYNFIRNFLPGAHHFADFICMEPSLGPELFPYSASKKLPSWITSRGESPVNEGKTIRKCPGILDFCTAGYIIPMWTDLRIEYDSGLRQITCTCSAPWSKVQVISGEQFRSTPVEKMAYPYTRLIKLETPWRLRLQKGCSSLMLNPYYSDLNESIEVLPGIIDHDLFGVINIFLALKIFGKGAIYIRKGTPLLQIIPFSRAGFHMKARAATQDDYNDEAKELGALDGRMTSYRKLYWKKKRYD